MLDYKSNYDIKMKHVGINFHFIKDLVVNGSLDVRSTSFGDQVVAALIKPLDDVRFFSLKSKLMMFLTYL